MAKIKICLDAGHDGKYNQSSVVPAYYESDFNWKLYTKLKAQLEQYDIEVIGTRDNQNIEMGTKTRGRLAKDCAAFFSLHANWAERESADHVVIYEMLGKKKHDLAVKLAETISKTMGTKEKYDIRTKQKDSGGEWYGVLQGCEQVSSENGFILEHSFYSNRAMATWMMDDDNIGKLAEAEAAAIAKYFGVSKQMSNNNSLKSAEKVVQQAQSWLGYNEADGSHKQIIDVYNSHRPLARGYTVTYTDAWCATFVSAVSIKLGYTDIMPTECGCSKMIALYQNLGAWVEDDSRVPNPGDIIFYDWQDSGNGDNTGSADHVGIVESVNNGIITIIEGNYSNSVKRRQLEVNGKNIRGYGVPKYDKKASVEEKEPEGTRAFQENDIVSIKEGAVYTTGAKIPTWVRKKPWIIKSISGNVAIIDKAADGSNSINSPVDVKYLELVQAAKVEQTAPQSKPEPVPAPEIKEPIVETPVVTEPAPEINPVKPEMEIKVDKVPEREEQSVPEDRPVIDEKVDEKAEEPQKEILTDTTMSILTRVLKFIIDFIVSLFKKK